MEDERVGVNEGVCEVEGGRGYVKGDRRRFSVSF